MIEIRKEVEDDYDVVREVNNLAFGQEAEGVIVDKIRSACDEILSLVAVEDSKIVGHILFSPVSLESGGKTFSGMGLGPMAVLPVFQNQKIGTQLVNEGLKQLKELEVPFVIVLGHVHYYPRFGFEVASKFGLYPQWQGIPDEAFMVLFLDESMKGKIRGVVKYRSEFDETP